MIIDLLAKTFSVAHVLPHTDSTDREGVLEEIVQGMHKAHAALYPAVTKHILLRREEQSSTAIGPGLAVPHGFLETLSQPFFYFARSCKGVHFHAWDGTPTHLFFVFLFPSHSSTLHLQALAWVSHCSRSPELLFQLHTAATAQELFHHLSHFLSYGSKQLVF